MASKGDYREAKRLYARSLEVGKAILGLFHQETAKNYYNIGTIFYDEKDAKRALPCFLLAYKLFSALFGDQHEDFILVYKYLIAAHDMLEVKEPFPAWLSRETDRPLGDLEEATQAIIWNRG